MQASKNFAANLRQIMETRGISQRRMADMSGVTFAYINRILLEKNVPSLDVCEKISSALDVDLAKLITKSKKLAKSA